MLHPLRPDGAAPPAKIRIERIVHLPEEFADLAADALGDGQRMLEVLREDWHEGRLRFDDWGDALFAAHIGSALVGLCGLTRDPYLKTEIVGRVRRLYVLRAARRSGVGRALVTAVALQAAESGYPRLRVRAPVAAFAFYESCGFLRAVGEPAATHARILTPG
ncbi:GNAT family N-acetyltransferase [Falsiroseomonas tokyonensis]|uniref:GNAT family N-acetyltransferase n=1 Tax=Falsiroseomonas tokyonensis TaxID=430521 RepID=A0ABV7BVY0_9PROT|nr:GNAT family N-acetyltransferase [Falsiroseomonas tokyonensis]MBU8538158.1 GNAT family N-acetyltransferase [Falsiroseomonas tokyonensis]